MRTARRTAELAPPLAASAWWRRLALLLAAVFVSVAIGSVVVWACISFGDWDARSEGGDGKLLMSAVMVAVGVPAGMVWFLVRSAPLISTAKRREPGEWMTPVAYAEDRELETRDRLWRLRTEVRPHWWVALYPLGEDTTDPPEVVLEVFKRRALGVSTWPAVAVYGHRRFGRRAVMAVDGKVVWPRAQDSALPYGARRVTDAGLPW